LLGTNPNSSHTTQFAENPRAALELVEKPFIVDMFPNLISPLFHTNMLAFKNGGRYSYAKRIRPKISNAVSNLLANNITFFSGKKFVSHNKYIV
jgi:hypothetical protein